MVVIISSKVNEWSICYKKLIVETLRMQLIAHFFGEKIQTIIVTYVQIGTPPKTHPKTSKCCHVLFIGLDIKENTWNVNKTPSLSIHVELVSRLL